MRKSFFFALPTSLILAQAASAHPGPAHIHSPFFAGLAHPWLGFDHLAAALAIGIWSAQMGSAWRLRLPGTFLLSMLIGAFFGLRNGDLPFIEAGILCTVIGLGLLIASAARPGRVAALLAAGAAGFLHGYVHGSEAPFNFAGFYFLGLLLATAVLHAAGVWLGLAMNPRSRGPRLVRGIGWAIAALGTALALGLA